MRKIRRKKTVLLTVIILSWILSGLSIPGIVLSAVYAVWWSFIPCLLLIIYAMYGLHFVYVCHTRAKWMLSLMEAIEKEGILSVTDLAARLSCTEERVRADIADALRQKYLTGFDFDGDTLQKTEEVEKI